MFILRPNLIRPRVTIRAKKDDFVAPTEAPGEGKRRPPTWDEGGEPYQEVHHESFQNRGDRP